MQNVTNPVSLSSSSSSSSCMWDTKYASLDGLNDGDSKE
jgi:hypothetical protein